jgi:molybdopterin-guanine dinucleotide biosynthesis protein A
MPEVLDLTQATLAVLAGGAGQRMGMPKSHLIVAGRPILNVLVESLKWPGPLLLVTSPEHHHPPGRQVFAREVIDPMSAGPLRAILTALQNCQTPHLAVIPVDMIFLRRNHLEWLLGQLPMRPELLGVMPKRMVENKPQIEPLPFVCRQTATADVAQCVNEGNRSVRSLIERKGFATVAVPADWPDNVWTNLNTPDDLRALRR